MKRIIYIFFTFVAVLWNNHSTFAQDRIYGFVSDSITGESLIGANIYCPAHQYGTITDNNGYFSLPVLEDSIISVSYTGYVSKDISIKENRARQLHVRLAAGQRLEGVSIYAKKEIPPNVNRLSIKELQAIPSQTGKPDVLKALHNLPGVQNQNEASALLLVRGGNPGENLYLFDNVPIIYVNHLGGFLSVFNPDIINGIDFYKGNFPSKFGGKLSSVVNITQKKGTNEKHQGSFSLGITDASLLAEGPIGGNATYILTGRKTLFDYLLMASTKSASNNSMFSYGFHDFNGKISWFPNEKNTIHLNFYQGDDYMLYRKNSRNLEDNDKNKIKTIWGNVLASLHMKSVISSNVFVENIVSLNRYRLKNLQESEYIYDDTRNFTNESLRYSSLQDLSFQSNWKYSPNEFWKMMWGLKITNLLFTPLKEYTSESSTNNSLEIFNTYEFGSYLENSLYFDNGFNLNAGLRVVSFKTDDDIPLKYEPRLHLQKRVGLQLFSVGYMETNQFAQLLFTTGSITSNEVWIPAGKYIKPSSTKQFSLNWNGAFTDDKYQVEACLYYKILENLTTFAEGYYSLSGSSDWSNKVTSGGTGTSYGFEIQVKKTKGKWTGSINYGLSKTTRLYPTINNGKIYPFEYDRPHTGSINIFHVLSPRLSLSCSWVYQTGLPYTPAIGKHITQSIYQNENGEYDYYKVLLYGERNSSRIKDYHRLDVALQLKNLNQEGKIRSEWTFSIYNLYNRKNPICYFYKDSNSNVLLNTSWEAGNNQDLKLYQLSLFPIIPSVSYKIYFDVKRVKHWNLKERFNKWMYYENK